MSRDPINGALNAVEPPATPVPGLSPGEAQFEGITSASTALASALRTGAVIDGRYRIDALLGAGGMSIVYKAYHLNLDRSVAIKMLHPHLLRERRVIERFLQEARAESTLRHANIVTIHAVGASEDGQPFLVMDYLQGQSLADLLKERGKIPEQQAVPIFRQICGGLAHAHAAGVVHRDLKPSNIMLLDVPAGAAANTSGPLVKIVDFGIARLLCDDDERQQLTNTGMIVGSPSYMSPEQCTGERVDARSDLYSLGCLMYEVLTGHLPIEGGTIIDTMRRQVSENPPPFFAVAPDISVSEELENAVFAALRKRPSDRFASVDQLAEILEDLDDECVHQKPPSSGAQGPSSAGVGISPPMPSASGMPSADRAQGASSAGAADAATWAVRSRQQGRLKRLLLLVGAVLAGATVTAVIAREPLWHVYEQAVILPQCESDVRKAASVCGIQSAAVAPALVRLGDCLYDLNRRSEASDAYRTALTNISLAPHTVRIRAVELLCRAYAQEPLQFGVESQKAAAQLLAKGELNEAQPLLEQAARDKGGDILVRVSAYNALIDLLIKRGQYESALASAREAIQLALTDRSASVKPALGALYERCGEAEINLGMTGEALKSYNLALASMPERTDSERLAKGIAAKRLAEIAWLDRQYAGTLFDAAADAERLFNQVKPLPVTELAAVKKLVGDAEARASDDSKAGTNYERALALLAGREPDKQLIDTKRALADSFFRQQRFGEARVLYTDVLVWMNAVNDTGESGMIRRMLRACSRSASQR